MSYEQYSHDLAVGSVLRLVHRQASRLAQSGSEMSFQLCKQVCVSIENSCFDVEWARLSLRVDDADHLVSQHLRGQPVYYDIRLDRNQCCPG